MQNNNKKLCIVDLESIERIEYILDTTLNYINDVGPRDLRGFNEEIPELLKKIRKGLTRAYKCKITVEKKQ